MNNLKFYKDGQSKIRSQKAIHNGIKKLYRNAAKEIQDRIDKLPEQSSGGISLDRRRLTQLQEQINRIIDNIGTLEEELIKDNLYTVADNTVKAQKDWLVDLGFNHDVLDVAFSNVPQRMVEKMVSGQIYQDGWNLSDSIWQDKRGIKKDLYTIVAQGLVQQDGIFEIAQQLERYVNPNKKTMWNLKMTDGRRIFRKKVDYNSQRLARTLIQHGYQQNVIDSTKDNPFINHWVWRATGSRACDICKKLDGTVYSNAEDIPMDHPNGMCTIEVADDPNMIDRLADWINGEDEDFPEITAFAETLGYTGDNVHDIMDLTKNKEFMTELEQTLESYVGGGYQSPKDALTDTQFEYILSQLEEYDGIAYRLESRQHTLGKQKLSIGDTFSFDDNLRSFSTDRDYMDKIINDIMWGEIPMENPVMYKTEGKVNMFNMRNYAKGYFEDQSEAFLGGAWEILNVETQLIGDLYVDVVTIKQRKSPSDILDGMLDNNTSLFRKFYTEGKNYIQSKDNQWQFDFTSDKWWQGLTEKEKDAVKMYTGAKPSDKSHFPDLELGVDYRALNEAIRNKTDMVKDLYDEYTKVLDDALSKHALKNDSIFYRGISNEELKDILNKKEMPEYKSLTTDQRVVDSFSQGGYSMEVRVPKEANGGYIGGYSKFTREKEFLLGKGTQVKIIDYDDDARKLYVEVVGQIK